MNHCHDCNSDYAAPGTCNCFAPGGKRAASPLPSDPTAPTWPKWPQGASSACPNCGGFYVGTHVCGYYNPNRSPTCVSIGPSMDGVG